MTERLLQPVEDSPSERLWRAVIGVDMFAHEKEPSLHSAAETIGVAFPNQKGQTVVYELDYLVTGNAYPFTPRIRSQVYDENEIYNETITLISDRRAQVEGGLGAVEMPVEWTVTTMAERMEALLHRLQTGREDSRWWIVGSDSKESV